LSRTARWFSVISFTGVKTLKKNEIVSPFTKREMTIKVGINTEFKTDSDG